MRSRSQGGIAIWLAAAAVFAVVAWQEAQVWRDLGEPALVSGYALLAAMAFLAIYNLRKRLSMVPIGAASGWFVLHTAVGVLALALFWLHIGGIWPSGGYERVLTLLLYLVTATGLLGLLMQQVYPRRLFQSGFEIIYERIPAEIARLRDAATEETLAAAEASGNDTLAAYYRDSLHWYFARPRFFWSHALGGRKARHWLDGHLASVARYLGDTEKAHLERLAELARRKTLIDLHYACQGLLKWWLFLHIPFAAGLLVLALWHWLIVHIYLL